MRLKFSVSSEKISVFIKKYSFKITYIIIIISFLYITFFLYQYLYLPISGKKPIDPSLIQSKKEVINQKLFEKVTKNIEEKVSSSDNAPTNINNPF